MVGYGWVLTESYGCGSYGLQLAQLARDLRSAEICWVDSADPCRLVGRKTLGSLKYRKSLSTTLYTRKASKKKWKCHTVSQWFHPPSTASLQGRTTQFQNGEELAFLDAWLMAIHGMTQKLHKEPWPLHWSHHRCVGLVWPWHALNKTTVKTSWTMGIKRHGVKLSSKFLFLRPYFGRVWPCTCARPCHVRQHATD